jgi:hypothetical protein
MSYGTEYISNIVLTLFYKDKVRLETQLTALIDENHAMGEPRHGFLFEGQFWTNLPKNQRKLAEKRLLHASLHDSAQRYFTELHQVEAEKERLTQGLHLLLRDCHTMQDVRDALPDLALMIVPEFARFKRQREEAWPLQNKPLHFQTSKMISDIFGFYATNQILY